MMELQTRQVVAKNRSHGLNSGDGKAGSGEPGPSDSKGEPLDGETDVFGPPGLVDADRGEDWSLNHSRVCRLKRDRRLKGLFESLRAVNANPKREFFVTRPRMRFCHCNAYKYEISLSRTVRCFGCGANIRCSGHRCGPGPVNAWLSKAGTRDESTAVRRRNFALMCQRLPYRIPDQVLNDPLGTTPACGSVVFEDRPRS